MEAIRWNIGVYNLIKTLSVRKNEKLLTRQIEINLEEDF